MKKLLLSLSIIVLLAAGCAGQPRSGEQTKTYNNAKQVLDQAQVARYEGEQGRNALELLKEKYNVETKQFSFGEMVVAIDGKRAEDGKNFWSFYVNGQQAQVGASQYVTKTGDVVEWRLEEIK